MEEPQPRQLQDQNFPLFKPSPKPSINPSRNTTVMIAEITKSLETLAETPQNALVTNEKPNSATNHTTTVTFSDLGLSQWLIKTCNNLSIQTPRPIQHHFIPKILQGRHVIGIDETGSGKTAAFGLPILQRLAEHPFGVFALVVTPTWELASQVAEQFRALGSSIRIRIAVVVGGVDMIRQSKELMDRPHIVVATPGRINVLLRDSPEIVSVFSKTKFLVLDEADRVLDVGFQEELKFIFQCLPKNRQNLFFSATTTSNLQKLRERYQDKLYAFEAYEGFKTAEKLEQQVIFIPKNVKDVYLMHILSNLENMGVRSAIVFVSTCRDCHRLNLMLEVLDKEAAALYSFRSQAQRLEALHQFKSAKVPILLATDVAGRGLDIPTVDLVINYDVPRIPRDYIHRVGRTARAGRGGRALSLVTQNDVNLIREIEALIEIKLEKTEYNENDVLSLMKKVLNANKVANMKMMDDGFEEKAKERKKQKLKMLEEKGLLKERSKRKRNKEFAEKGKKKNRKKVEEEAFGNISSLQKGVRRKGKLSYLGFDAYNDNFSKQGKVFDECCLKLKT